MLEAIFKDLAGLTFDQGKNDVKIDMVEAARQGARVYGNPPVIACEPMGVKWPAAQRSRQCNHRHLASARFPATHICCEMLDHPWERLSGL